LRFQLRFVSGPIAIDFPGKSAEFMTGRRAPRIDRFMCGCEFSITADVRRHNDFACRRLGANYFAFVLKWSNDLHAEVYDHCNLTLPRVMVKETVMTVGPQAFMAPEKIPD
jgi:hypothetical protein